MKPCLLVALPSIDFAEEGNAYSQLAESLKQGMGSGDIFTVQTAKAYWGHLKASAAAVGGLSVSKVMLQCAGEYLVALLF